MRASALAVARAIAATPDRAAILMNSRMLFPSFQQVQSASTQAPSQLVQPLRQLNRCPPRIRNKRTCYSRRQHLVRRIQLDPARLQLLAERLEVLNLETN